MAWFYAVENNDGGRHESCLMTCSDDLHVAGGSGVVDVVRMGTVTSEEVIGDDRGLVGLRRKALLRKEFTHRSALENGVEILLVGLEVGTSVRAGGLVVSVGVLSVGFAKPRFNAAKPVDDVAVEMLAGLFLTGTDTDWGIAVVQV